MKKVVVLVIAIFSIGSLVAQTKIGHVNSTEVRDTMSSYKKAVESVTQFEKEGVLELQEMEQNLNLAYQDYEMKKADRLPTINKMEEEKLMKKQQDLQTRQQELQMQMQQISQELNQPILDLIQKAVAVVAKRHKLNYIIDVTSTLYFEGGIDYTKEVMTEVLKLEKQAEAGTTPN